jgi:putative ABC transport system substrate-binding protein
MNRRAFVTGLGAVLAAPLGAWAQQQGKVYQIGVLASKAKQSLAPLLATFRERLRDLGFADDRIVIEVGNAGERYEILPQLAAEFVRRPVDVIVTAESTPATLAAKQATSTIPIVMVAVGDPIRTGLVDNLGRPGGNVTGSSALTVEVSPKRLEIVKQLLPHARRVALLWNPENPANVEISGGLQRAASEMGVTLFPIEVRRPGEFDRAFTAVTKLRPDALIVTGDPMHQLHISRVIDFAARRRLPTVYNVRANVVEAGGLLSYAADVAVLYRRAATYVAKILTGTRVSDLPVEQPTEFELVINAKTAKGLGLTIPPSLLLRADQVIE